MKLRFIALSSVLFVGLSASARPETTGHEIMRDMQELATKCVVQSYAVNGEGKKVYAPLKSACSEIEVVSLTKALVTVKNETFVVVLRVSEDTDGGDLDHVLVYNQAGQMVAQRLNVLAFDNILMALAGGKTNFAEVEESSN